MTKYGVCNYDFAGYKPQIKNLEKYETFEEAYEHYMDKLMAYSSYPYSIDKTLWYVWIEDDKIVQFEQLDRKTRCKIVGIK